jgi:folate-dependent tRNA-U54 methylase TrmFO/GidA
MTVYVLQEMGRNIRSAEKFGDLKVVLPDNKQIVLSSGPLTFKLKHELKDFNDNDYLLLMGDPAIIAVAGAVVSDVNGGKFKVLKWDRDEKKYYDIEIDLRGMNEQSN